MNKERLLNVARALRESPNPELFTMEKFGRGCGTPCCALGHYAARADLQDVFALAAAGHLIAREDRCEFSLGIRDFIVLKHFDINGDQAKSLFDCGSGCDEATTPEQAARFIERFVAND